MVRIAVVMTAGSMVITVGKTQAKMLVATLGVIGSADTTGARTVADTT